MRCPNLLKTALAREPSLMPYAALRVQRTDDDESSCHWFLKWAVPHSTHDWKKGIMGTGSGRAAEQKRKFVGGARSLFCGAGGSVT